MKDDLPLKLLLLWVSLLHCTSIVAQNFTESAAALGIDTEYGIGLFGGGVSFVDFNNDGLDDLTFTTANNLPMLFYQNTGSTFISVPLVSNTQETKEALWADYDNDGDQDLFVTGYNSPNRLYRNDGGTFTDVTISAFGALVNDPSFGAAWGDYNQDGVLDLYVCNYLSRNILWRGSTTGVFEDVTSIAGVGGLSSAPGFDVCILDYDGNGWPDIYVINDKYSVANVMYFNNNGVFTQASNSGTELAIDAMNAGGGDFDNDGDFDLYVTNTEGGNFLLSNNGSGIFTNVTAASGTALNVVCWGANAIDYDNDTDLDIYVSAEDFGGLLSNPFLVNQGDGSFEWPLMFNGGLGGSDTGISYGNATGDFNEDGLPDIIVSQSNTPFYLWQNQEQSAGNYFKVSLFGTISNRDGIGARVEIDLPDGTQLTRWQLGSEGYLSQNTKKLHFGIGDATSISEMRIFWPSGLVDVYPDIASINQLQYFLEGEAVLPVTIMEFTAEATARTVALQWVTTQETDFDYFAVERSVDGISFSEISRVTGHGSFSVPGVYSSTDQLPHAGHWYYRLRMVDLDGSTSYSVVRAVSFSAGSSPQIYVSRMPANPATEGVSLEVYAAASRSGTLQLIDAGGRVVLSDSFTMNGGYNTIDFSSVGLPTGLYYLRLSSLDWTDTLPVVLKG